MDYTLNNFNKVTFVHYLPLIKCCEPSFRLHGESGKDIATDVGKISLIQQSSAFTGGFTTIGCLSLSDYPVFQCLLKGAGHFISWIFLEVSLYYSILIPEGCVRKITE